MIDTDYSQESFLRLTNLEIKKEIYVFVQIEEKDRIKKAVFIDFRKIREGYWLSDIHANWKYKIDSSSMTINGKKYLGAPGRQAAFENTGNPDPLAHMGK